MITAKTLATRLLQGNQGTGNGKLVVPVVAKVAKVAVATTIVDVFGASGASGDCCCGQCLIVDDGC